MFLSISLSLLWSHNSLFSTQKAAITPLASKQTHTHCQPPHNSTTATQPQKPTQPQPQNPYQNAPTTIPLFTNHHQQTQKPPTQKLNHHHWNPYQPNHNPPTWNPLPHISKPTDPQPNRRNSALPPIHSHNHPILIYNHSHKNPKSRERERRRERGRAEREERERE